MIEEYLNYARGLGAREEVILWINQTLKAHLSKKILNLSRVNQSEIEHILDFLISDAAPKRLLKMSIEQAKTQSDKWSKANQKKGRNLSDDEEDIKTIHQYSDGSRIVKLLSKDSYKREGYLMSHCLGGYSPNSNIEIYSYRDSKNMPHATFEVQKQNNSISQIKGKGNGPIHPKYIMPILDFLTSIGQVPRPSEMKNLGYYHIDKSHHDFVKSIVGAEKNLTFIYGELYAHP